MFHRLQPSNSNLQLAASMDVASSKSALQQFFGGCDSLHQPENKVPIIL
jgi:hypothetical protein